VALARPQGCVLHPHLSLEVSVGAVPDTLAGARCPRPWLEITDREALVRFHGGARLLVSEGERVRVQIPGAESGWQGDASWLVQGWGVTIASLQRGRLSLHAATMALAGRTVGLAGERGAGKSTTAMGLRARGHALLVDDVTLIDLRDDSAWARPFARNVHLLADAADALGLDFASLPRLAGGRSKVAFAPEPPSPEPRRLDAVLVLAPEAGAAHVSLMEVHGAAKVRELLAHTHRDGVAPLIMGQQAFFWAVAELARALPVFVLRRPARDWSLDAVLDAIEGLASALPDPVHD
jgi:hypothetical protein